jgi:hypothetical protein
MQPQTPRADQRECVTLDNGCIEASIVVPGIVTSFLRQIRE